LFLVPGVLGPKLSPSAAAAPFRVALHFIKFHVKLICLIALAVASETTKGEALYADFIAFVNI